MAEFTVLTVLDGTVTLLASVVANGFPRLFEGVDLYVYGIQGNLFVSRDQGETFESIPPVILGPTVGAMCQTSGSDVVSGETSFGEITIICTARRTTSGSALYQETPETTIGWRSSIGSLGTLFVPSDAIASMTDDFPILIGNSYISGSSARVKRCEEPPPFRTFLQSDSGLPTAGFYSAITDLEAPQF